MRLEVRLQQDTLWLNLNQMAALFERDMSALSRHLEKIYCSGELERNSVVAFFATTAADGKTYQFEYYNFETSISIGYGVNTVWNTFYAIPEPTGKF